MKITIDEVARIQSNLKRIEQEPDLENRTKLKDEYAEMIYDQIVSSRGNLFRINVVYSIFLILLGVAVYMWMA